MPSKNLRLLISSMVLLLLFLQVKGGFGEGLTDQPLFLNRATEEDNSTMDLLLIRVDFTPENASEGDQILFNCSVSWSDMNNNTRVSIELMVDSSPVKRVFFNISSRNGSRIVILDWKVQRDYHNATVKLDPDNNITEKNENDNVWTTQFWVQPPEGSRIDIFLHSISLSKPHPTHGETLLINASIGVENITHALEADISLSVDSMIMDKKRITLPYTNQSQFNWTCQMGNHSLRIDLFAVNLIQEERIDNNYWNTNVDVLPPEFGSLQDVWLEEDGIRFDPDPIIAWHNNNLSVEIWGSNLTQAFAVELILFLDSIEVGRQSTFLSLNSVFPIEIIFQLYDLELGEHNLIVELILPGVILEKYKENNLLETNFTVGLSTEADLSIQKLYYDTSGLVEGNEMGVGCLININEIQTMPLLELTLHVDQELWEASQFSGKSGQFQYSFNTKKKLEEGNHTLEVSIAFIDPGYNEYFMENNYLEETITVRVKVPDEIEGQEPEIVEEETKKNQETNYYVWIIGSSFTAFLLVVCAVYYLLFIKNKMIPLPRPEKGEEKPRITISRKKMDGFSDQDALGKIQGNKKK